LKKSFAVTEFTTVLKQAVDTQFLLDDQAVQDFIIKGYHLVEVDFPPEFHQSICQQIDHVFETQGNPWDAITDLVPDLFQVYEQPVIEGALTSILGHGYTMNSHRHCHFTSNGHPGGHWHQDSVNVRHHRIERVLAMYYPQDVTEDMGPTIVLPGTQYHNTPSTLMASYMNFKHQVPLTVKAGTVAITHYDIWHAWMPNTSTKNRRMLKFLFDRTDMNPTEPSWNAGPYKPLSSTAFQIPMDSQSEAYKHRIMWQDIWNWLHGKAPNPDI
jgi:ectoine hydroxylase-related dioxygenase (phytanoyl-CoA dioxygenase family)